jgi:DivIVA domain-containing protein
VEILTPQFRIERGGYAVEDVDALLNQFFALLESNPASLTAAGLRSVRFRQIPGRPGYAPNQVDSWIDTVARQLASAGSSAHATGPDSSGPDSSGPASSDRDSMGSDSMDRVSYQSPGRAAVPAPYEQPERGFDPPGELFDSAPLSPASSTDPSTDPGRNAVQELPATPPWASLTILIVLGAMIVFALVSYFR